MKPVRCAIYTRKSSDEGLEQGFNSLDAQREACAAYIKSQASEGWTALPDLYDDGGVSGGTLERPALKRLLADVAAGKVDVIVVYKVDRLSRSLFDFAKLVEQLEKANCSFVSITQPISTTTSMGRLTLNMLLSFAQFEREVTAERIRDKIAASKAKGMFMGGVPPIGYKNDGRTLVIVPDHAALVRDIFERYVRLGSVRLLEEELARDRIVTPHRVLDSGREVGGQAFLRNQLRVILKSRLYLGEIPHKEHVYKGLHPPLIDKPLWDQVQTKLHAHLASGDRAYHRNRSLLAGKLFDEAGEPLIPVHSSRPDTKSGGGRKRFSYYVSRSLHHARSDTGMRVPAREIDCLVVEQLSKALDDPLELITSAQLDVPPGAFAKVSADAAVAAAQLRRRDHDVVGKLLDKVVVRTSAVELGFNREGLETALGLQASDEHAQPFALRVPVRLTRSGMAMRFIEGGRQGAARDDPALIRLVAQARRYWLELRRGELNITELAAREKIGAPYITRALRLAFLSPEMIDKILAGKQPVGINVAALLQTGAVDPRWGEQGKAR